MCRGEQATTMRVALLARRRVAVAAAYTLAIAIEELAASSTRTIKKIVFDALAGECDRTLYHPLAD
eukprot:scaffold7997_cov126-Isochrysis_galbana.AAC.9